MGEGELARAVGGYIAHCGDLAAKPLAVYKDEYERGWWAGYAAARRLVAQELQRLLGADEGDRCPPHDFRMRTPSGDVVLDDGRALCARCQRWIEYL